MSYINLTHLCSGVTQVPIQKLKKLLCVEIEGGEWSVWRSCLVRYQRLNSSVIPRQTTSGSEEARAGHRLNIRLRILATTVQNRLVYYLRDENNQQKQRFLCEKLQEVRNKQKKRNTTPWMRSVAAKIVTAQFKG